MFAEDRVERRVWGACVVCRLFDNSFCCCGIFSRWTKRSLFDFCVAENRVTRTLHAWTHFIPKQQWTQLLTADEVFFAFDWFLSYHVVVDISHTLGRAYGPHHNIPNLDLVLIKSRILRVVTLRIEHAETKNNTKYLCDTVTHTQCEQFPPQIYGTFVHFAQIMAQPNYK